MSRRRKDFDPVPDFIKIAALLGLLLLVTPALHKYFISVLLWVVTIAGVCLAAFVMFRLLFRHDGSGSPFTKRKAYDLNTLEPTEGDPAPSLKQTLHEAETLLAGERAPRPNPSHVYADPPIWKTSGSSPAADNPFQRFTSEDLEARVRKIDWYQFEKIVALLYEKMGYRVDRRGGANPDGGIDLTIERNTVVTAIQCKQWKAWRVGVRNIREFVGALTHAQIESGIFITLKGYTQEAKDLADQHNIEIVDEPQLLSMIRSTDMAYDPAALEILRDEQKYCPKCERPMVLRTSRKGLSPGDQFWGCSGYPQCKYKLPYVGEGD